MHFSLKHALVALTAVAILFGVLVQIPVEQRVTNVLWAAAAVSFLFAFRGCFRETPRRGAAFGFVLGAATYAALAFAVPTIVPPFQVQTANNLWNFGGVSAVGWHDFLRLANAIGVILAGALGALLGAVVFRSGRRDR
jgi:hypothetical protein